MLPPCRPTVSISAAQTSLGEEAPYVAEFSSRGPPVNPKKLLGSRFKLSNDILKPDILAPGVNLLGAWTAKGKSDNAQFLMVSGTSMATPILAGRRASAGLHTVQCQAALAHPWICMRLQVGRVHCTSD